jgi:hypothetical protein
MVGFNSISMLMIMFKNTKLINMFLVLWMRIEIVVMITLVSDRDFPSNFVQLIFEGNHLYY